MYNKYTLYITAAITLKTLLFIRTEKIYKKTLV